VEIDEVRLEEFLARFAADVDAAAHATTVVVGDKLGLYRALAELGPTQARALAEAASQDVRFVEEWLHAQCAAGYCHFSRLTETYWLSPEQTAVLADRNSPNFMVGAMTLAQTRFQRAQ
jgi:hypothetical protein